MRVRRALITVHDKTGIEEFARGLDHLGIELIATAGTGATLQEAGLDVMLVSDLTRFPEPFLGGRVKTLQPALYAGLLADRGNPMHMSHLQKRDYLPIDLLCCNLYPFGETDQETRDELAIGHIDIGGPMLLHAAALNHLHVVAVTRRAQYQEVLDLLEENDNQMPESALSRFGAQAFAMVASYEAQVSAWFSERYAPISAKEHDNSRFGINWTCCAECSGAVASHAVDQCLRHLRPADRHRVLEELDGSVDLRNVQVSPTLMEEILDASAPGNGRPRLSSLRCEWTHFEGPIDFRGALITGDVDLAGARLGGPCVFDGVTIRGELRCRDTRFRSASFEGLKVDGLATFRSADFHNANFRRGTFSSSTIFERTEVMGDASFENASFLADASFIGATFHGMTSFEGANWRASSRFRDVRFAAAPECADLSRFQEANWPREEQVESRTGTRSLGASANGGGPGPRVFIASSKEEIEVGEAIQVNLDHTVEPHLWTQQFVPGGTIATAIVAEFQKSDFAVIVLGPDDVTRSRAQEHFVPRDNVVLEIGIAAGVLGPDRTFLVKPRGITLKLPSDLEGIIPVDYDESRTEKRAALGAATTLIKEAVRRQGKRTR